jgi:hypothetical protein
MTAEIYAVITNATTSFIYPLQKDDCINHSTRPKCNPQLVFQMKAKNYAVTKNAITSFIYTLQKEISQSATSSRNAISRLHFP